jgi:hypothetical protein
MKFKLVERAKRHTTMVALIQRSLPFAGLSCSSTWSAASTTHPGWNDRIFSRETPFIPGDEKVINVPRPFPNERGRLEEFEEDDAQVELESEVLADPESEDAYKGGHTYCVKRC